MLAMQQRGMAPLPPLHTPGHGGVVSGPMSPPNSGPLSPAALSATIQRVASPHGSLKMSEWALLRLHSYISKEVILCVFCFPQRFIFDRLSTNIVLKMHSENVIEKSSNQPVN